MANNVEFFRAHEDVAPDIAALKEWCHFNGYNFGCVMCSFIPAITYAMTQQTFINEADGERYVRADFGDILVRKPYHTQRQQ